MSCEGFWIIGYRNESQVCVQDNPEYSVVITSEKPAVNPNESLNFMIYITGGGEPPSESKIAVYTDGSYNITRIWIKDSSTIIPISDSTLLCYVKDPSNAEPLELDTRSFIYAPLPRYLFDVYYSPNPEIFAEIEGMVKFGIIEYEVFIPKDIRPGDHETHVVFSYNDSTKWHTEQATFKFHVNTWYERNQSWLVGTSAISAVVVVFGSGINVWNWLKRRQK